LFSKKSAPSKLLAPHGELIFDGFWWDFAKQGINLASKSTPKYSKSNRREAIRFDSRTAKSTPKYAKSNRREAIRFDSRTAKLDLILRSILYVKGSLIDISARA